MRSQYDYIYYLILIHLIKIHSFAFRGLNFNFFGLNHNDLKIAHVYEQIVTYPQMAVDYDLKTRINQEDARMIATRF